MDTYAKSVQDVDAALNRLNATLAAYRSAKSPVKSQSQRPGTQTAPVPNGARQESPAKHPLPIREQAAPVAQGRWKDVLDLRASQSLSEITKDQLQSTLNAVPEILSLVVKHPYCLPLYIVLGQTYVKLGYPDLASGAAYKALLLSDAVQDAADEYHEDACDALREVIQQQPLVERISLLKTELHADLDARHGKFGEPDQETDVEVDVWLREHYLLLIYRLLTRSLLLCGCYRTAREYSLKARRKYPHDHDLCLVGDVIRPYVAKHFGLSMLAGSEYVDPSTWPDKGLVRRELYPWNDLEPDRLNELPTLNAMMAEVAPKLQVRAVELPALTDGTGDDKETTVTQLGVFAKEDIAPGEVILDETSMLTANNKLQDALCDACSADLPDLDGVGAASTTACPDCEVVFCSESCYELATDSYHPGLCGMDVEAIAKDVPPAEAADSLYALLLLRVLAMAETRNCHPLRLKEVRYIWGDFHNLDLQEHWCQPNVHLPWDSMAGLPRTLPFNFDHNVRLPFHMLEKMDIDIFANPQYDVWVLNTLYAKFRGTASARLSGLGGRAIRGPEVSAVHPLWCLANHSCDPNVSWEWGGSIRFWARDERVRWQGRDGEKVVRSQAGIQKGEEVLNHYTDIQLPVKERREWARGALGGDCMCARCIWEAEQETKG